MAQAQVGQQVLLGLQLQPLQQHLLWGSAHSAGQQLVP
jgi:hypothetical protein